jgi:hypothetical protein
VSREIVLSDRGVQSTELVGHFHILSKSSSYLFLLNECLVQRKFFKRAYLEIKRSMRFCEKKREKFLRNSTAQSFIPNSVSLDFMASEIFEDKTEASWAES